MYPCKAEHLLCSCPLHHLMKANSPSQYPPDVKQPSENSKYFSAFVNLLLCSSQQHHHSVLCVYRSDILPSSCSVLTRVDICSPQLSGFEISALAHWMCVCLCRTVIDLSSLRFSCNPLLFILINSGPLWHLPSSCSVGFCWEVQFWGLFGLIGSGPTTFLKQDICFSIHVSVSKPTNVTNLGKAFFEYRRGGCFSIFSIF